MCMSDYEVQSSMTNFNVGVFSFFLKKKKICVRNKFLSDQDLKFKFEWSLCTTIFKLCNIHRFTNTICFL